MVRVLAFGAVLLGLGSTPGWAFTLTEGFSAAASDVTATSPPPPAPSAGPELHWAPSEDLEAIDVALIDGARQRIDLAAYVLTDRAVIVALARAAARGVAIRIVLDPSQLDHERSAELAALRAAPGVASRIKRGRVPMHLKSYAIDGAVLRTGSANFSASGLKHQENELFVARDGAAVDRFEAMYAGLFEAAE